MNRCAKVDEKHKAVLRAVRHLNYASCVETTQNMIQQAETLGSINLDEEDKDHDITKLIWDIIEIIAKDSLKESI